MEGPRLNFFAGLCLLCLCSLALYQVEDGFLGQPAHLPRPPTPILNFDSQGIVQEEGNVIKNGKYRNDSHIWVTMALCWSSNTKYHDKGGFPYRQAALFSSQLWKKWTPATVIMQVRRAII